MANKKFWILLLSAWLAVSLHLPVRSQVKNGLNLAIAAQELYSVGKLSSAADMWQQAADVYQDQKDRLGKTKSLINKAQVLQDMGLYPKACDDLLEAFEVANPDCSPQQVNQLIAQTRTTKLSVEGIGLRSLANVLKHKGRFKQSRKLLQLSQRAIKDPAELGSTLLALGNIEQVLANKERDRQSYDLVTEIIDRQNPLLALKPYQKAFSAYETIAADRQVLPITQTQAQLNYLNLLIEIESWWHEQTNRRTETWQRQQETELIKAGAKFTNLLESKLSKTRTDLINGINDNWSRIPVSHESIYARINYSNSLIKLSKTTIVESTLKTALAEAQKIQDRLGESYGWGYLGKYYGQRKKMTEAIACTRKALVIAQENSTNSDTREMTYLWNSQLGQLLEQKGQTTNAIAAYTSAFNTLQFLRADLNTNNKIVQFDFRQEVKPVYLHLANLLLQSDPKQAVKSLSLVNRQNTDQNLESARQVIESLQLAELDNFFQDPCSETTNQTITIDQIDPHAAVVYPIMLSDRLDIILSLPNQPLQRFTTAVSQTKVNQTIDLLYDSLYNPSVNNSAVNIFSTTMVDAQEIEENMQTLLPILQQINSWLIEPLTPALKVNQVKTLVFVLNGRLQNVPISALFDGKQYLLEKYSVALAPSLQLLLPQPVARNKVKVLAAGLSQQVEVKDNFFPALTNVPAELNQIEEIFPQSQQLLDEEFTVDTIQKQLASNFSIVHLATHGLFSSNPDETFIVTGDGQKIDVNRLSNLLNSSSVPPDLVVLSACETAAGDELAVLGLAGVAVRSGASSTIASLWSVDDASTAQLMGKFYQEFKNPDTSKVDALQKAQLSLMNVLRDDPPSPALKSFPPHPYYWSPYVLVGNWQ